MRNKMKNMNKAHKMSAGPELDALLAEKLMGWRRFDNWSQGMGMEQPFFLVGESGVIVYRHPDLGKSWSPRRIWPTHGTWWRSLRRLSTSKLTTSDRKIMTNAVGVFLLAAQVIQSASLPMLTPHR
jgi:hypothetical protein